MGIKSVMSGIWNALGYPARPTGVGEAMQPVPGGSIYKAVIPQFLYKPPYGYPRFVDIPEIRRLASTPYVEMCISTIIDEICAVKWDIVERDGYRATDGDLQKVRDFFNDPNVNKENFNQQMRKILRDILTIDSGVWVKVFDRAGNFRELFVRDGGTFTMNPDIFGTFADRAELVPPFFDPNLLNTAPEYDQWIRGMQKKPAYYQYGWITGARPMPFGSREIVYLMKNPRPDSLYGRAPVEILLDTIQMLVYGIDYNLEYYTDNSIPKGVFQMIGADQDAIDRFVEKWKHMTKVKNEVGDWRKAWHKMPVIGTDGKFTRVQFSNAEMELITQQQWFTKIVWACFGVTPSELGFTESSNKATELVQSKVFRRKTIRPILELLQFHINNEVVWQELSENVEFRFDTYDVEEDIQKHRLIEVQLRNGIKTPNEVRKDMGLEEIEGGDTIIRQGSGSPFGGGFAGMPFPPELEKKNSADLKYRTPGARDKRPRKRREGRYSWQDEEEESFRRWREYVRKVNRGEAPNIFIGETQEQWETRQRMARGIRKQRLRIEAEERRKKAFEAGSPLIPKEFEEMTPERLEKKLVGMLKENRRNLVNILESYAPSGKKTVDGIKALDKTIIEKIKSLISFASVEELVRSVVRRSFLRGLDRAENEMDMNFVPDQRAIDFMEAHTFDNIKDMGEEIKNDLRSELERGLMAGEGTTKLKDRVMKVFDANEGRAKAIARTETNRASNMGHLNGYQQAGVEGKKRWMSKLDDRTSALCRRLDGQETELNENFKDREWEGPVPPAHVNCRSRIIFVPKVEENG